MQNYLKRNWQPDSNFLYQLESREYVASYRNNVYRNNREYPLYYVDEIAPMMELEGHTGCVNRLDWNENGDLLASGSDDTTVKIWKPFEYYYCKKKNLMCNIQTDHIHNLFGVRFIPGTNDRFLCTGSMDKLVQIQSIERQCTIKNYEIHSDRVKDVQITPRHPYIFYSVSEDGTIRRFDIRLEYKQLKGKSGIKRARHKTNKHLHNGHKIGLLFNKLIHNNSVNDNNNNNLNNGKDTHNGNVIIKLNNGTNNNSRMRSDEASYSLLKGLSINPVRDYEFAIASGDEYVRIFDIRRTRNSKQESECVAKVTPPHLSRDKYRFRFNHNASLRISTSNIHTTFVEYSNDGSQMVVTYHGENVYVFNTKSYDESTPLKIHTTNISNINQQNDYKYAQQHIYRLKKRGNECFHRSEYSLAIQFYQNAIKMANKCHYAQYNEPLHALYCNLAMCLFHRMHFNDLLLAIFYSDQAIECNPNYVKAYFWKLKILNKITPNTVNLKKDKQMIQSIHFALKLFPNNKDIKREHDKFMAKVEKRKKRKNDDDNKEEDDDESSEEEEEELKEEYVEYEYYQRYTGHCNLKTDIKEATFFGDKYICSGSDDGRCFIWDKSSGQLMNILCGVDQEVVNTVRRHPHFPMLAMSGIDSTIKIWQPACVEESKYETKHKIAFTNYGSHMNKMDLQQNIKMEQQLNDRDGDDEKHEESRNHHHLNTASASVIKTKKKINQVIQENQENLSNPPSHQIDLSTLLFWANLMNQ